MRFCHVPTASPASFKRHEAAEQRRWGAAAVAAARGGGERAEKRNSKEPEIASVRVSDSVLNMVILRGVAFYLYLIVFLVTLVNHLELWQGSALLVLAALQGVVLAGARGLPSGSCCDSSRLYTAAQMNLIPACISKTSSSSNDLPSTGAKYGARP